MKRWGFLGMALVAVSLAGIRIDAAVEFVFLGKEAVYDESTTGGGPNESGYAATVFVAGTVTMGTVTAPNPGGDPVETSLIADQEGLYLEEDFDSVEDLDTFFPDGSYALDFPGEGTSVTATLSPDNGSSYPAAPDIDETALEGADPDSPLTVSWNTPQFAAGTSSNDIEIRVTLENTCTEEDEVINTASIEGEPGKELAIGSTSTTIDASLLEPGTEYILSVGFYHLTTNDDTQAHPVVAGYLATTEIRFTTAGVSTALCFPGMQIRLFHAGAELADGMDGTWAPASSGVGFTAWSLVFVANTGTAPSNLAYEIPTTTGTATLSPLFTNLDDGFFFSTTGPVTDPTMPVGGNYVTTSASSPIHNQDFTIPDPADIFVAEPTLVVVDNSGILEITEVQWELRTLDGNSANPTVPIAEFAVELLSGFGPSVYSRFGIDGSATSHSLTADGGIAIPLANVTAVRIRTAVGDREFSFDATYQLPTTVSPGDFALNLTYVVDGILVDNGDGTWSGDPGAPADLGYELEFQTVVTTEGPAGASGKGRKSPGTDEVADSPIGTAATSLEFTGPDFGPVPADFFDEDGDGNVFGLSPRFDGLPTAGTYTATLDGTDYPAAIDPANALMGPPVAVPTLNLDGFGFVDSVTIGFVDPVTGDTLAAPSTISPVHTTIAYGGGGFFSVSVDTSQGPTASLNGQGGLIDNVSEVSLYFTDGAGFGYSSAYRVPQPGRIVASLDAFYEQTAQGTVTLDGFAFFSEVTETYGLRYVDAASVTTPLDVTHPLVHGAFDDFFEFESTSVTTVTERDSAFPTGTYEVNVTLDDLTTDRADLTISGTQPDPLEFTDFASVSDFPFFEATDIEFTPWREVGESDPQGLDFIEVLIEDRFTGNEVMSAIVSDTTTSVSVPAYTLESGTDYDLYLAAVDVSAVGASDGGTETITAFFTETRAVLQTAGPEDFEFTTTIVHDGGILPPADMGTVVADPNIPELPATTSYHHSVLILDSTPPADATGILFSSPNGDFVDDPVLDGSFDVFNNDVSFRSQDRVISDSGDYPGFGSYYVDYEDVVLGVAHGRDDASSRDTVVRPSFSLDGNGFLESVSWEVLDTTGNASAIVHELIGVEITIFDRFGNIFWSDSLPVLGSPESLASAAIDFSQVGRVAATAQEYGGLEYKTVYHPDPLAMANLDPVFWMEGTFGEPDGGVVMMLPGIRTTFETTVWVPDYVPSGEPSVTFGGPAFAGVVPAEFVFADEFGLYAASPQLLVDPAVDFPESGNYAVEVDGFLVERFLDMTQADPLPLIRPEVSLDGDFVSSIDIEILDPVSGVPLSHTALQDRGLTFLSLDLYRGFSGGIFRDLNPTQGLSFDLQNEGVVWSEVTGLTLHLSDNEGFSYHSSYGPYEPGWAEVERVVAYEQTGPTNLALDEAFFFAGVSHVFENGYVDDGSVVLPDMSVQPLTESDFGYEFSFEDIRTDGTAVNMAYPDGTYGLDLLFETGSSTQASVTLGGSFLSNPLTIVNWNDLAAWPEDDHLLEWTNPEGLPTDLIEVIIVDLEYDFDIYVAELPGDATSHWIPGDVLESGTTYELVLVYLSGFTDSVSAGGAELFSHTITETFVHLTTATGDGYVAKFHRGTLESDGSLTPDGYRFEAFVTEEFGDSFVASSTVLPPGGSPVPLAYDAFDRSFLFESVTFADRATLDADYPPGTFALDVILESTATDQVLLDLPDIAFPPLPAPLDHTVLQDWDTRMEGQIPMVPWRTEGSGQAEDSFVLLIRNDQGREVFYSRISDTENGFTIPEKVLEPGASHTVTFEAIDFVDSAQSALGVPFVSGLVSETAGVLSTTGPSLLEFAPVVRHGGGTIDLVADVAATGMPGFGSIQFASQYFLRVDLDDPSPPVELMNTFFTTPDGRMVESPAQAGSLQVDGTLVRFVSPFRGLFEDYPYTGDYILDYEGYRYQRYLELDDIAVNDTVVVPTINADTDGFLTSIDWSHTDISGNSLASTSHLSGTRIIIRDRAFEVLFDMPYGVDSGGPMDLSIYEIHADEVGVVVMVAETIDGVEFNSVYANGINAPTQTTLEFEFAAGWSAAIGSSFTLPVPGPADAGVRMTLAIDGFQPDPVPQVTFLGPPFGGLLEAEAVSTDLSGLHARSPLIPIDASIAIPGQGTYSARVGLTSFDSYLDPPQEATPLPVIEPTIHLETGIVDSIGFAVVDILTGIPIADLASRGLDALSVEIRFHADEPEFFMVDPTANSSIDVSGLAIAWESVSEIRFDLTDGGSYAFVTVYEQPVPGFVPVGDYLSSYGLSATDLHGDADGDGISNLIEYLFGLSPVAADAEPFTTDVDPDADEICIYFQINAESEGYDWVWRTSVDLVNWLTATSEPTLIDAGGTMEYYRLCLPWSDWDSGLPLFFHFYASEPVVLD